MKERPILFSTPMVRAILAERKTQTRRVVKLQPMTGAVWHTMDDGVFAAQTSRSVVKYFGCPYGQPGDQLWVREEHFRFGHWEEVPGRKTKTGRMKWQFVPDSPEVVFDPGKVPGGSWRLGRHHKDPATPAWHKRLARFMPRAFARIMLEVVSVRVERLQDISEADALAEGIEVNYLGRLAEKTLHTYRSKRVPAAVLQYADLWESINGPGSWDANPWVWVVTFKTLS